MAHIWTIYVPYMEHIWGIHPALIIRNFCSGLRAWVSYFLIYVPRAWIISYLISNSQKNELLIPLLVFRSILGKISKNSKSVFRIFRSILLISRQYRRHFPNQREILYILVMSKIEKTQKLYFAFLGPFYSFLDNIVVIFTTSAKFSTFWSCQTSISTKFQKSNICLIFVLYWSYIGPILSCII